MRIAQQENSVEKRGWVAWFTRKTNKTSRQEVCTTYIGHRRPSILLKERKHWGLPGRILEAQAKLVSLAGLRSPDGNSARGWEKEWHEETSISRNWSQFFIFQGLFLYTEMLYKSHAGSAVLTFIKVTVLHTNVYRGLRGVTSSSGQGACWQFMTLSELQRSVNTYFSRGDYS